MLIGVPKEIKDNENRVAITPAGVHAFTLTGHQVVVEKSAGVGSGITDEVLPGKADCNQPGFQVWRINTPQVYG